MKNFFYKSGASMIGGFSQNDGTIDFYLRINSLVDHDTIVLDLGAGRAAWYEEDECKTRKEIRLLKGKVRELIAADVDKAVIKNNASDKQILIKDGKLDLNPNSVDLVLADYVLEHIDDPKEFYQNVNHVLKSGGWFCARTPHKYSYVAIASSLIKNSLHSKWLGFVQPSRKEIDVFDTRYKLNELKKVNSTFSNWEDFSFIYRAEPAYYFGSRWVFLLQSFIHRLLPEVLIGNLFVFVRKP